MHGELGQSDVRCVERNLRVRDIAQGGTACHVRGGASILEAVSHHLDIKPGETTKDLNFTLETVACLGACGLAPVMMVNDNTHGRLTPDDIPGILDSYLA